LIFDRKDIDMKKLEQVQMMQRLAKQQHELMEFIAKTEELVLKIDWFLFSCEMKLVQRTLI
jgi:hypothetical protein